MKINQINNTVNFGREALMTCQVKQVEENKKYPATLYKMDQLKADDYHDIQNSRNTNAIKLDFENEYYRRNPIHDFYILQNDKTREIIGCAEKNTHFKTWEDVDTGVITLLQTLSVNPKYLNAGEPIFTYIVKDAKDCFRKAVTLATGENIVPNMGQAKFTENKDKNLVLRSAAFEPVIEQGEKRYGIQYIA
ncbi:hypothetical protein II906_05400 [bacterium]|nr:hypothetical protein [bacterium]